ncbi:MAG: sugar phosphate isomerase/epimerase family protein [Pseudomonadota bacterium]
MGISRRTFVGQAFMMAGAAAIVGPSKAESPSETADGPLFKISLAQWSLHRALFGENGGRPTLDAMDFPLVARREFGVDAVEYVAEFYYPIIKNKSSWDELKKRCDGEGVTSNLVMCSGMGRIGDPDQGERDKSFQYHQVWIDFAAHLGCQAVRVDAYSEGTYREQQKLAADGMRRLAAYAEQYGIYVIAENHGFLSSNPDWLSGVIKKADHPLVGTLPDFGNFDGDPYRGVKRLMPFAKGVSAKSGSFDTDGNETGIDYRRMLSIVVKSGYRGYVGIEYEGRDLPEAEGIRKTKALLERVRADLW